jgi:hypothetical protein
MNRIKQKNVIIVNFILTIFVTFLTLNVAFAADSDLDLSFGGTGKVTAQVGDAEDNSSDSAIQNDGKIVVAGSSGCCGSSRKSR